MSFGGNRWMHDRFRSNARMFMKELIKLIRLFHDLIKWLPVRANLLVATKTL